MTSEDDEFARMVAESDQLKAFMDEASEEFGNRVALFAAGFVRRGGERYVSVEAATLYYMHCCFGGEGPLDADIPPEEFMREDEE